MRINLAWHKFSALGYEQSIWKTRHIHVRQLYNPLNEPNRDAQCRSGKSNWMGAIQESFLEKPGLPGLAFGILNNGLWWRDSIYSGPVINQSSSLVTLTVFPGEPAMTLTFDKCDLNTLTPHLCSLNGTPNGMTRKESTLRPRTVYAKAQIKKGSRSAEGQPPRQVHCTPWSWEHGCGERKCNRESHGKRC